MLEYNQGGFTLHNSNESRMFVSPLFSLPFPLIVNILFYKPMLSHCPILRVSTHTQSYLYYSTFPYSTVPAVQLYFLTMIDHP